MKFINEYNDPKLINKFYTLIDKIMNEIGRPVKLMEVCGTHTMNIGKAGIRSRIPKKLILLSGPGCPVCVTPSEYVSYAIELAKKENTIITTFGDMVKVPNSKEEALKIFPKNKVRIVYTPLDTLTIAKDNPDKEVIFLGVGFETTIPVIGQVLLMAYEKKLKNFSMLTSLKTVPEPLKILSQNENNKIDGFILPGHVSIIIGLKAYEPLGIRGVVTGFEPLDILMGIYKLLQQVKNNEVQIENQYPRAVTYEGNIIMQNIMKEVFQVADTRWRGLSTLPKSGLIIKKKYEKYDTMKRFNIKEMEEGEPKGCQCGNVLIGVINPRECPLFGKACTPDNPIGPCMVSSEGACSAYYKYEQ